MASALLRSGRLTAAGFVVSVLLAAAAGAAHAGTVTICTLVVDLGTESDIHRDGDCSTRHSPASTFKVPLAVIGFDAGFLKDPHDPVLTRQDGEADWGGDAWNRATDPTAWLEHSVVWYSQRIAKALGAARIEGYLEEFGYGNADMSGDPGKDNGLMRGWISSSLKISPDEQVRFVSALAGGRLPVASQAMMSTIAAMDSYAVAGWRVKGKTGSYFPRKADGNFDRARAYGWFVGFAEKDGRRVAFVRLNQDTARNRNPSGPRARDGLLEALPGLVK